MADLGHPNRKRKRVFHRIASGITRGGALRLLTLTSSPNSPENIHKSFRALVMRLRRRGLIQGYVQVTEQTKSGLAHKHVLFRGSYVAQAYLSATWNQIHQAPVVDIRSVRALRSNSQLAGYLAKYASKQDCSRFSWDWGWVWKGFCTTWSDLKKTLRSYSGLYSGVPYKQLLWCWNWLLYQKPMPTPDWRTTITWLWSSFSGQQLALATLNAR